MGILDKILKRKKTEDRATATNIKREFAEHPSSGLIPSKIATIMQAAEQGNILEQVDLFADIEEKDGHVCAEIGKRKRALLSVNWEVLPPKNASFQEKKLAEKITDILENIEDFEDVILGLADSIGYGFSCLEIEWQFINNVWQPKEIEQRPHRWFCLNRDDRNEIRLRDGSAQGEQLADFGWVVHKHKAKSGDVSRAGLFRALVWPFIFKNYSIRDLAEFLEIYGIPPRLGVYQQGATDDEKNTLLRTLASIGHNAAGIMPEGMRIDFMNAASGVGDPFMLMVDWCERTQSKVILGGTLTSGADGKSSTNALGNVHNEVRHDLLVSDAMQIASTLTKFIADICTVNGWDNLRCPKFHFDTTTPEDFALFADAMPKLAAAGMQIPLSFLHEKLKIPTPKDNEPVLTVQQPQSTPQAMGLAVLSSQKTAQFTPDQQAIENIADEAIKNTPQPIDPKLIKTAIFSAKNEQELKDNLAVLLDNSGDDFEKLTEKALFAAGLIGYLSEDYG